MTVGWSTVGQLHTTYGKPAGWGRFGFLDLDGDEKLICHECGKGYLHLATHLRLAHEITAEAYRELYGLGATEVLVAPSVSSKLAESWDRHADAHLAALEAHRDTAAAAARSRAHTKAKPWAPATRAKRQAIGRASRSQDLTPEQARSLGDGIDLQKWADAARVLRAQGVSIAAIARASGIVGSTVSQRLRYYPPK